MQLEFSGQFFEKSSSDFIKIRPAGAEMFHADGQTNGDRHDKTSRQFSQFCRRAQNQSLNCTPLRMNRRAVVVPFVWSRIPFWVITGTVDRQSFGNYYLFPAPVLQAWNCGNICTAHSQRITLLSFFFRISKWRLTFLLTDIFDIHPSFFFLNIHLFCNSCYFLLRETGELDCPYSVRPRGGLLSRMWSRLYVCGNHKRVFPFTFENANNRSVKVCFMRMPVVTITMGNWLKVYQGWGEYFDSSGKELEHVGDACVRRDLITRPLRPILLGWSNQEVWGGGNVHC